MYRNYRSRSLLLSIVLGLTLTTAAYSEVPRAISYQGRLTDNLGAPVADGSYNLNFRIWDDPTSVALVNLLWESGSVSVSTVSGLFSVDLGAPGQAALPESLFVQDTVRWLSISVNGAADLTPRTKLTSVAFAYVAGTVPDSSLGSGKITNEAGITSSATSSAVAVPNVGVMSDIITTSITTPGFGFVLVIATSQIGLLEASAGGGRFVIAQIDQTSGGGEDLNNSSWCGTSGPTNSITRYSPVAYSRFYLVAQGTYTFRLEAYDSSPAVTDHYFWSPRIHAIYFPTYYGLLFAAQAAGSGFGAISTAYTDEEIAAGMGVNSSSSQPSSPTQQQLLEQPKSGE